MFEPLPFQWEYASQHYTMGFSARDGEGILLGKQHKLLYLTPPPSDDRGFINKVESKKL
jgi:hypothetical protein